MDSPDFDLEAQEDHQNGEGTKKKPWERIFCCCRGRNRTEDPLEAYEKVKREKIREIGKMAEFLGI